jgi:O-methyltransferase involved in polyketide biosynthesis
MSFVGCETETSRYTKALCYGAFQYLEAADGERMLSSLRQRFQNLKILYLGNLPDRERMEEFSRRHPRNEVVENRADSLIGIWRTPAEFITLAGTTGWRAEIRYMPESFYAAHYRYDAVMYPA